jgi:nicotinamide-nucleotide adenylyltransferase
MATEAVLAELESDDDSSGSSGRGVRLLLLLAVRNADKAAKPAAFEQRLAMMWAFARDVRAELERRSAGGDEEGGVPIDVALATQPYFHEKSAAIAESGFYKPTTDGEEEGGKAKEDVREQPEQVILAGYDTLIRIFDPKYYGPPAGETAEGGGGAGETAMYRALDPLFKRARLRVTMRTDAEWGGKLEQTAYVEELLKGDGLEKIGGSREWARRINIVEGRREGETVISSTLARKAAKDQDWERLEALVPPEVKKWIERGERLYADA